MAKLPWKTWHEVVKLRDDLRSGDLPLHPKGARIDLVDRCGLHLAGIGPPAVGCEDDLDRAVRERIATYFDPLPFWYAPLL